MEPATIAAIASGLSSAAKLFGGGGDQGDSMKDQYAWNMYSARMLPQQQVEGLRLAGLNPMLAVGKGMQSAPGITNNTQDDRAINISRVNSAAQIAQTIAQTRLLDAQKENVEADTQDKLKKPGLTEAQTETERNRPENIQQQTKQLQTLERLQDTQNALTNQLRVSQEWITKQEITKHFLTKLEYELQRVYMPQRMQQEIAHRIAELREKLGKAAEGDYNAKFYESEIGQILESVTRTVKAVKPSFEGGNTSIPRRRK